MRAPFAMGRRQRRRVAASAGVALLLLLAVLPVEAADRPLLSQGSISPTTGAAGTSFVARVTYTSSGHGGRGWPPGSIRLWLGQASTAMVATDPTDHDYQDGATFQATVRPAAGRYHVVIRATGSRILGRDAALDLGTLVVGAAPTAPPPPSPTPSPRPSPRPSPTRPPARPTPRVTSTATPTARPTPAASASPTEPDLIALTSTPTPTPTPTLTPTLTPSPTPLASADPPGITGGGPPSGGRGGTTLAALTAGLPPLGSPEWLVLFRRQLLVAAAGTTMMALALFTFRRRQSDDAAPVPQAADPVPPRLAHQVPQAYVAQAALPLLPGDAGMPRWRRPSLRAARQAKPGTDLGALEAQRLTFAHSGADPMRGVERRRVRYRLVRLGDGPDEILSQELGLLDQGDEVELLRSSGVYWQVRTPLGQVGWIHRMTLGEVIPIASPAADPVVGLEPYTEGLAQRLLRERPGA